MLISRKIVIVLLIGLVFSRTSVALAEEYSVAMASADGKITLEGVVDTDVSSFTITKWVQSSKSIDSDWTPKSESLPLSLFAYDKNNSTVAIPKKWNGKIEGWAFLLPFGRDSCSIPWRQGELNKSYAGSSFGWKGLRNSFGDVVLRKDQENGFHYVPHLPKAQASKQVEKSAVGDMRMPVLRIAPAAKPKDELDVFKNYKSWAGVLKVGAEKKAGPLCKLKIVERDGKAFAGELTLEQEEGKSQTVKIKGTTANGYGAIRFKTELVGKFEQEFLGETRGSRIMMWASGKDESGKPLVGSIEFEPKSSSPR